MQVVDFYFDFSSTNSYFAAFMLPEPVVATMRSSTGYHFIWARFFARPAST